MIQLDDSPYPEQMLYIYDKLIRHRKNGNPNKVPLFLCLILLFKILLGGYSLVP